MRLLVCGGRDYRDREAMDYVLGNLHAQHGIDWLVTGDAPGADEMAFRWAVERYINAVRYHAEWRKHGKAAGPMRNQRMLDDGKPDVCVAFPGGKGTPDVCVAFPGGKGTQDMVRRCEERKLMILLVPPREPAAKEAT